MAGLNEWSSTPASNASVGSINWAEGQNPSTVNNSARQVMADVAAVVDGTAVLTGWGVEDGGFIIYSTADATKKVKFDASGLSAGTTRVLTFPNASGTIALTGAYQPLDDDLTAIAALTQTRGNVPQSNGTTFIASASLLPDNLLANGSFDVWQRGTAFTSASTPANSDDTYLADRWVNLSDGNDIVDVSKETTTIPSGAVAAIKLDVETANKKFGILQVLEQKDAIAIIGGTASLAFEARKGASNSTVDTLRAAVITWSSTADSVTSDVVSAWAIEGTNPTLATNWTYENTPSNLTLTNSFQEFRVENVSVDTASGANVAVFIWCDNADATVGDLVYISKVRLVPGAVATPVKRAPHAIELSRCQRYYEKFASLGSGNYTGYGLAACYTTTDAFVFMKYSQPKRTVPTVVVSGCAVQDGTAKAITSATSFSYGDNSLSFNAVVASGLTIGKAALICPNNNTTDYISLDAEL
jgi:hypothetical protein